MNISSKAVINSVNQLQIWSDIFGKTVSLNTKYCNPLRVDKNPGCWLKKVGNKVYLIDYGCSRFHYIDIFKAVEIRYNLKTFSQVVDKVIDIHVYGNNKVNFEKIDSYKTTKKFKFKLEYRLSEFDDIQNQYWSRRGITLSQLESDNIKFTNCYRCNTRNHQDELFYFYPRMAYVITFESGNKKIVIPNSKQRFITDANAEDIGGVWDMNGEQIVVTKSYKDYRHLKNLGYNTLFNLNEGAISKKLISICESFKDVVIFYDNDRAGIEASSRLSSLIKGSREVRINDENSKDPDELFLNNLHFKKIIKNIINEKN